MAEHPRDTYLASGVNLAERQEWAGAITGWASDELVDFAIALLEFDVRESWPFEDVTTDPFDWEGVSIEFHGARPDLLLTDAQVLRIQDAGFSVARVHYCEPDKNGKSRGDYVTPKSAQRLKEVEEKIRAAKAGGVA